MEGAREAGPAFDDARLALWDRASGMDGGDSLLQDRENRKCFLSQLWCRGPAGAIICLNRNVVFRGNLIFILSK